MNKEFYFINEEIDFYVVNDKIKRKLVARGGDMMIVEVHFEEGAVGDLHQHIHEQVSYCISGKLEFEVNGEKQIIGAGDSVFMPIDSIHGCTVLEKAVLLDIFTPQREDFLALQAEADAAK
ncbi:MAG: cupin domain-containing protein [Eubacteriales bacterium]